MSATAEGETRLPLFGDAWAQRLAAEIATSEPYRRAAAGWEGALVLALDEGTAAAQPPPAVWADLFHGA